MAHAMKLVVGAFVASGLVGLLGEFLNSMFISLLGPGAGNLPVVLVLVVMGVVGAVLVVTGSYQRLEDESEMGLMGTFVGFVPAAAKMYCAEKARTGSAGKSVAKTIGVLLVLIMAGALVAMAIELIALVLQGGL